MNKTTLQRRRRKKTAAQLKQRKKPKRCNTKLKESTMQNKSSHCGNAKCLQINEENVEYAHGCLVRIQNVMAKWK